jgi:hypothetical protein
VTKNVFIIGNSKGILEGIAPKRELDLAKVNILQKKSRKIG